MPLALKLIAAGAFPSSARAQFRFNFRRIPCTLGRTRRDARERAGTTTTRSYRTESSHNKLLGFEQTTRSTSGTASTSGTHQYDAAGNLQTDGLHQYHYDSQGRLQSSQTGQGPDAPTTRYAHNALGQRVFKTEPLFAAASSKGGALDDEEEDPGLLQTLVDFFTKLWNPAKSEAEHLGWAYVYDEEGSLLGEYGMGGAQSAGQSQYLYLPTASGPIPIAAEIDNRLYAIHTDHLGTPRRLTQADGQAAWQWAYTPYGDEAPTLGAKRFTNETTNPTTGSTNIAPVRFNLRYPGQYFDAESGLHYNYFRSYDPRTGRYTQTDPIGLEGGWNRFAYVNGDPLNGIDPDGLHPLAIRLYNAAQGAWYRYAPALTEFIAGASGVNGAVVSPMSPLVAQIPTTVSRMTPVARAVAEGVESGGFCSANTGRVIKLSDGFYEAANSPFKFSEYYYHKLWGTGRGAPFLQAEEVLSTATSVAPDRMAGFYRYVNGNLEMVYNPVSKEMWHLMPTR